MHISLEIKKNREHWHVKKEQLKIFKGERKND